MVLADLAAHVSAAIGVHQYETLTFTGVLAFATARGRFAGAAALAGVYAGTLDLRGLGASIGARLRLAG